MYFKNEKIYLEIAKDLLQRKLYRSEYHYQKIRTEKSNLSTQLKKQEDKKTNK